MPTHACACELLHRSRRRCHRRIAALAAAAAVVAAAAAAEAAAAAAAAGGGPQCSGRVRVAVAVAVRDRSCAATLSAKPISCSYVMNLVHQYRSWCVANSVAAMSSGNRR
jgi:hypothetical protein